MLGIVAGASGAIGRSVVGKLLIRDYTVLALVRNKIGEFTLLDYLANNNIRVNQLYIFNADFLHDDELNLAISQLKKHAKKFKGADIFINCAGIYTSVKKKSMPDVNLLVNYIKPVQLFLQIEPLMKPNARVVFLLPKFSNIKSPCISKTKLRFLRSKLILYYSLKHWIKKGQKENVYFYIPKITTSDFFIKNVSGKEHFWGQIRNFFGFPPEFSAEQIITIATRNEFDEESGAVYYNLSPISLSEHLYNKKLKKQANEMMLNFNI